MTASTPRRGLRVSGVDPADRPGGDRRLHQRGMNQIRKRDVRGVRSGAAHLARSVNAIGGITEKLVRDENGP